MKGEKDERAEGAEGSPAGAVADPRFAEAIAAFNRRDYFSSQQRFEQIWHDATADDRAFLEALVQLSVALHLRFHRGGARGSQHLLQACLVKLEDSPSHWWGVDMQALRDEVLAYVEDLRRARAAGPRWSERWRVPRIHWVRR